MNLTRKIQQGIRENLTLDDLLPTSMPVYVNSVAYLFGVSALSSLVVLALSGVIMAIFGPTWYHNSSTGHFINSVHFWAVQLLFFSLLAHMLTKIFMSAWRDGRWKTWFVGTITFVIAALAALTGFLAQTNWDSQWIAVQAKDLMNELGVHVQANTNEASSSGSRVSPRSSSRWWKIRSVPVSKTYSSTPWTTIRSSLVPGSVYWRNCGR